MNKKEFIAELKKALTRSGCTDITSVLEYYEELIADKMESGEKEKEIIKALNIEEIVKNVKVDEKIELAVKKPTLSNGIKALIATLSILSIPLLIPVGAVVFALVIVILSLIFSLIVTIAAIVFASGAGVITVFFGVFMGKLPFGTAMFLLGAGLISTALFATLFKWAIAICKEFIAWIATSLKTRVNNRRRELGNE